nr:T9SS type A sorting domain-containing protein [Bacteroidota bacterium]
GNDFSLKANSPAINKAVPITLPSSATLMFNKDFDGNPRGTSNWDMGAYERQVSTGVLNLTSNSSPLLIYPNPANESAIINYLLAINSEVKIAVYDILGKEIMQVVNEKQTEGGHQLKINTANLQNGIYFVRMSINGRQQTQKLIISN